MKYNHRLHSDRKSGSITDDDKQLYSGVTENHVVAILDSLRNTVKLSCSITEDEETFKNGNDFLSCY